MVRTARKIRSPQRGMHGGLAGSRGRIQTQAERLHRAITRADAALQGSQHGADGSRAQVAPVCPGLCPSERARCGASGDASPWPSLAASLAPSLTSAGGLLLVVARDAALQPLAHARPRAASKLHAAA